MAYENPYLVDFAPIFFGVIKAKGINPAKVELIVFDEEPREWQVFERAGILDVLNQLREDINALSIYTDRPDFFQGFIENAYEETGLLTAIASKREQNRAGIMRPGCEMGVILDFEWKGTCYNIGRYANCGYIPIHKKPWEMRENLDILVPFGYNTVIVKSEYTKDKIFVRDRFEEGFYRDE